MDSITIDITKAKISTNTAIILCTDILRVIFELEFDDPLTVVTMSPRQKNSSEKILGRVRYI